MNNNNIISFVLSIIERRTRKQIAPTSEEEVLPSFDNEDTIKCKDFNMDSIDLCKINIKFKKERNMSKKIKIMTEDELFCDMV